MEFGGHKKRQVTSAYTYEILFPYKSSEIERNMRLKYIIEITAFEDILVYRLVKIKRWTVEYSHSILYVQHLWLIDKQAHSQKRHTLTYTDVESWIRAYINMNADVRDYINWLNIDFRCVCINIRTK